MGSSFFFLARIQFRFSRVFSKICIFPGAHCGVHMWERRAERSPRLGAHRKEMPRFLPGHRVNGRWMVLEYSSAPLANLKLSPSFSLFPPRRGQDGIRRRECLMMIDTRTLRTNITAEAFPAAPRRLAILPCLQECSLRSRHRT